MDHVVCRYFSWSLAPATLTSYWSAANRYCTFCSSFSLSPLPLLQSVVISFVVYLAETGVSYPSIHSYLSGICFYQIANGFPDPCLGAFPRLQYVLRGICRSPQTPRPPRLPVTPNVLSLLYSSWSQAPSHDRHDASMLWAACCVGFFGFMRVGEFTCSSLRAFNSSILGPRDITVDSCHNPTVVTVHLRHSKTDPFCAGLTV